MDPTPLNRQAARGFTLLELLIVAAMLAVIAVVVILVLNPAETLRKGRDSQRLSDLSTLKTAISIYVTTAGDPDLDGPGRSNCDIPETSANASTFVSGNGNTGTNNITDASFIGKGTPQISTANQDSTAVDGSGWIPIDFTSIPGGSPLANLPLDPNFSVADPASVKATDFLYIYSCGENPLQFELAANMESSAFSKGGAQNKESTDGGDTSNIYETGTSMALHTWGAYRAFVSSTTSTGNLGGLSGADNTCQTLAGAAGWGSVTWKAWLSAAPGSSPASSFVRPPTPIYLNDDATKIADGWSDLTDGSLDNAIGKMENGGPFPSISTAWTNTNTDGTLYISGSLDDCDDWTNGSTGAWVDGVGAADTTTSWWTLFSSEIVCASIYRFYCFSQSPL